MDETIMNNVKRVAQSDKTTENYYPALQFPSSVERFSIIQLIVLVLVQLSSVLFPDAAGR